MYFTLELDGDTFDVTLAREGGTITVEVDGEIHEMELDGSPGDVTVTLGEADVHVEVRDDHVLVDGERLPFDVRDLRPGEAPGALGDGAAGAIQVRPPMPGKILEVHVAEGDEVAAGDVLCILEAMKMQNEVAAPRDGTVAAVHVEAGSAVEAKDVLVELD